MKQVKINYKKHFRGTGYSVYFDRGLSYHFTSKKQAEKFCAEVSEVLQKHLISANKHYGDVLTYYRQIYLYLEDRTEIDNIDYLLGWIEKNFKLILWRYIHSDEACYTYEKLVLIFGTLERVLRTLLTRADQKKQTALKHLFEVSLRCIAIEQDSLSKLELRSFREYTIGFDFKLAIVA